MSSCSFVDVGNFDLTVTYIHSYRSGILIPYNVGSEDCVR